MPVLRPIVNPALITYVLDAALSEEKVVCEVPSVDGRALRFALPAGLVPLLELCDGQRSIEEIVAAYRASAGQGYPADRLERLVREFLIPKGLVAASPEVEPERAFKPRRSFLHLQVPLLGPALVDPLARWLSWAFSAPVLLLGVAVFVALHAAFYLHVFPRHALDFDRLDAVQFLALLLITTVSAFVHELGHVSAAAHYGCRRFEIGWGLYLVFTVFYSDVSDAWKLRRGQRAIVDLGGLYFQSAFLLLMAVLAFLTGDALWAYGFLVTDFAIVASLNPFLRLDGYWLLSDLSGIPNLRQHSLRLLRRFLPGRQATESAAIGGRTLAVLALYTVAGSAFFVWLGAILVDRVALSLIEGYPAMVSDLRLVLARDPLPVAEALSVALELLWRSIVLAGLVLLMGRLVGRVASGIGRFAARWRLRPSIRAVGGS